MRKTIIAGLVHNHVGGSFGSFGRVFRDKPDGEHDAPDFNPLGGDDSGHPDGDGIAELSHGLGP